MPSLFSWFSQILLVFEIYDSFLNNVLRFWVGPPRAEAITFNPHPPT